VLNRVLGVRLFGSTDGFAARFSPEATLVSLLELLGRAELYEHVRVSLKRILVGLLLALLIGVLGFTLDAFARGLHQRWGHAQLA
jgi:NitT/TauT family transport system permease protein